MIRTPSTLAMELLYATTRDLTSHEAAYLLSYHRITRRTKQTKRYAERLFGVGSPAALAAIWSAQRQEDEDLAYAFSSFETAAGCTEPGLGLKVIRSVLG